MIDIFSLNHMPYTRMYVLSSSYILVFQSYLKSWYVCALSTILTNVKILLNLKECDVCVLNTLIIVDK